MDSEQQLPHDLKLRIWEEEAKLERPLYRMFVRVKIPIKTDTDAIIVTTDKKLRKEPAVYFFFLLNSIWGACCVAIIQFPYGEGQIIATIKIAALFWLASMPAVLTYIREVCRAEEPLEYGGGFLHLIKLGWAPMFGLFGGWAMLLCLAALGFKSFLGFSLN